MAPPRAASAVAAAIVAAGAAVSAGSDGAGPSVPAVFLAALDPLARLDKDNTTPATATATTAAPQERWEGSFEEPEPAPETPEQQQAAGQCSPPPDQNADVVMVRERVKAGMAAAAVAAHWAAGYFALAYFSLDFVGPTCPADVAGLRVCETCGAGGNLIMPIFGEWEKSWPRWLLAFIYFVSLAWTFLGISVVCDQFMGAIEVITSAEKTVWHVISDGTKHKFRVKVWNDTVANLTLMALGSSAPEILLSVIEIWSNGFYAGELGPSTIVGSAAFNLLVITAVCICAIPASETRIIEGFAVFSVTAISSVLAYAWLLVILLISSPDLVEPWEGILTLLFFPLLCVVAFAADKGLWKRCCPKRKQRQDRFHRTPSWIERESRAIKDRFGKELPEDTLNFMLKQKSLAHTASVASKAQIRGNITKRMLLSGKNANASVCCFGFAEAESVVLECVGKLRIRVVASRAPGRRVEVSYRTEDITARDGVRYHAVQGTLLFDPDVKERFIEVEMIDDNSWQQEESFLVRLLSVDECVQQRPTRGKLAMAAMTGQSHTTFELGLAEQTIIVVNDDIPGTLAFNVEETYTQEGLSAKLGVVRTRGCTGAISCKYMTLDNTAIAGQDYEYQEGTVDFENGETFQSILVPILRNEYHELEGNERFQVVLCEPSPGVKLAGTVDESGTRAFCDVIIKGNPPKNIKYLRNRHVSMMRGLIAKCTNTDVLRKHLAEWQDQWFAAFFCNGGPMEQSEAGLMEWIIHAAALPWKVLFAAVPPPCFLGGWLCFVGALIMIGLVTVMVGELARLLGCVIGIGDDITAITLVALGTSLPDTVASKLAAQQDPTADNSIGNVTGSNSVNVFLGLGLPWTIAAVYWDTLGPTDDWKAHLYQGQTYWDIYRDEYPAGGFLVPAGSLAFSVAVFTTCALSCILLLGFRRLRYGGELGGPRVAQIRDAAILLLLWAGYVASSAYNSSQSEQGSKERL